MKQKQETALSVFFSQFPKLLLAGAMFSAIATIFMTLTIGLSGILAGVTGIAGFNSIFLWALGIIPTTIFYAGLVKVVRKYAVEKEFVPVVPLFFKTVKENVKGFLVNGIIVYLVTSCSFYALLFYFSLMEVQQAYGIVLTVYSFFTVLLIIMLFYVPLMSVTYELRYRDVYKNALYLAFKKIGTNLLTLLMAAVFVVGGVAAVLFLHGTWKIVAAVLAIALVPLIVSYIVVSMISKGVQENVGYFVKSKMHRNQAIAQEAAEEPAIERNLENSEDDYIFVNGKMIKNPNKKEADGT